MFGFISLLHQNKYLKYEYIYKFDQNIINIWEEYGACFGEMQNWFHLLITININFFLNRHSNSLV